MLEKYRGAIDALHPRVASAVIVDLGLPRYPGALYEMLQACGYHQSDVVLSLLRQDTRESLDAAEALVGRRIERCPRGLRRTPEPIGLQAGIDQVLRIIGRVGDPDMRRFVRVERNLQLPTTDSWGRYRIVRVGMTVGQFLMRGGTRRDVREWVGEGKVALSSA